MTQLELEEYVQKKVKDEARFYEIVPALNRAALAIATSENPLILLPSLLETGNVTTSTTLDHVTTPSDYLRHLYQIYNPTKDEWLTGDDIYPNRSLLDLDYPDTDAAGSIEAVCVEDLTLVYRAIPNTAETLTLYYYEAPAELIAGENAAISWLPVEYHEKLLGNLAAADILFDMSTDWDYSPDKRAAMGERAQMLMAEYDVFLQRLYDSTHNDRPKQIKYQPDHIFFF